MHCCAGGTFEVREFHDRDRRSCIAASGIVVYADVLNGLLRLGNQPANVGVLAQPSREIILETRSLLFLDIVGDRVTYAVEISVNARLVFVVKLYDFGFRRR